MSKQVAETIVQQLGGMGKLRAMVGAKDFAYSDDSLTFAFKGYRKANVVSIKLTPMDLYEVIFIKYSSKTFETKQVAEFGYVYGDQLKGVFESTTGLYLSL